MRFLVHGGQRSTNTACAEGLQDATIIGDISPANGVGLFGRGRDIVVEAFDLKLVSQRDVSAEGVGSLVIDVPAGVKEIEVGVGGLCRMDDCREICKEHVVDDEADVGWQEEK